MTDLELLEELKTTPLDTSAGGSAVVEESEKPGKKAQTTEDIARQVIREMERGGAQ